MFSILSILFTPKESLNAFKSTPSSSVSGLLVSAKLLVSPPSCKPSSHFCCYYLLLFCHIYEYVNICSFQSTELKRPMLVPATLRSVKWASSTSGHVYFCSFDSGILIHLWLTWWWRGRKKEELKYYIT